MSPHSIKSVFNLCPALLAACLLSTACRVGFEAGAEIFEVGRDAGPQDSPMPWGEYAATLDVPPCPESPYAPLVVNTTSDELDGGEGITDPSQAGDHLSFVEAMWIASNRDVPDTILFDRDVFPVDDPATILLNGDNGFPLGNEVCIDGRNRGVIIDWTEEGMKCGARCLWYLHGGSLQVGLTIVHLPFEHRFSNSQISGCRLATDGNETIRGQRFWTVELEEGAVLGPGNVISGDPFAVRIWGGDVLIKGNYFGYDPLSGKSLYLDNAFDLRGSARIEDNVIAACDVSFVAFSASNAVISKNFFGFGVDNEELTSIHSVVGIIGLSSGTHTVGPGNIIRGLKSASISIGSNANVRITRNSISGNTEGIVFSSEPPVDPPTITFASATLVNGTCPVTGTVEVFSDPGNQGKTFLGEVTCDGTNPWTLHVSMPSDMNVTATLTDTDGRTSAFSVPFPIP